MSETTEKQLQDIAELAVRRYFDHYLKEVWPSQQKAMEDHMILLINKHDSSEKAHGNVESKTNKLIWLIAVCSALGGGAGATAMEILSKLGS